MRVELKNGTKEEATPKIERLQALSGYLARDVVSPRDRIVICSRLVVCRKISRDGTRRCRLCR